MAVGDNTLREMTKYLVTGASGFIGSHIVDTLLARGHHVLGLDNMSTGLNNFLEKARSNPRFEIIVGDVLDKPLLDSAMEGSTAVYHMAANADIRGGLSHPEKDLEQNTIATFNVLEAMRKHEVKRIVFASSAAALGEPSVFPTPENCAVPMQTSLYGASKMAGEGLISAYCEGFGFEGYAFRFVSLLGARYPHGHVFDFVKQLLVDPTHLKVLGDGTQRKSYLNVEDCMGALMHICEDVRPANRASNRFEVFHLGVPEFCLITDSVRWICDELKLNPMLEYGTGNRGWTGDNPFVFLDVSKALGTGWKPQHNIEHSIRETARWLVDNPWIFQERR
jgi:UDP-glucose 4-epimerase